MEGTDPLHELLTGEVEVLGRMPQSSNATLLCRVGETLAIYKPGRGERPLWDYPPGLYHREVTAYRLAEALGWSMVPPTVLRHDTPLGPGSLQRFIEADFSQHYFTLLDDPDTHDQLRRICAFDLLANSGDRKAGHCLLDEDGHIWAIDNGLAFAPEPRLRTVIWDFADEPVDAELLEAVDMVAAEIPEGVTELLEPMEVAALEARCRALVAEARFPDDHTGMRYPWPPV